MYLFSCDLLLILSLSSNLGSLMVSDSTGLYLIRVQQKGIFKYKLWEWQRTGSMCKKMDGWKWLVSGEEWEGVTACMWAASANSRWATYPHHSLISEPAVPANTCSRWCDCSAQVSLRWDLVQCLRPEQISRATWSRCWVSKATPWAAPHRPWVRCDLVLIRSTRAGWGSCSSWRWLGKGYLKVWLSLGELLSFWCWFCAECQLLQPGWKANHK